MQKACDPTAAGFFSGGDDGDRTHYLLNAIQALSQVSYTPIDNEYDAFRRASFYRYSPGLSIRMPASLNPGCD
jgi:hypothetical protein